ncbi:MAG: class I SAM-dependent methyltransferase [Candidatus Ozemobacteraceae bacterium]
MKSVYSSCVFLMEWAILKGMDAKTIACYNRQAEKIAERYREASGGISLWFPMAFPKVGSRILDIGCGSGRDLMRLLEAGHDAYGWEPSSGLREEAIRAFPRLVGRIFDISLPLDEKAAECQPRFDGIVLSAVLMHLPPALLSAGAEDVKRLLGMGGRLLVSVPWGERAVDDECRDDGGRLFMPISADNLASLFSPPAFRLLDRRQTLDTLKREGIQWDTFLFERIAEC